MFPDSKITKNSCGRTKTTNVLSGAVAKESFSHRKSSDLCKWFGFATGGTSDENDKFLPMLIRHFARHFASNGLYWTCLILARSLNCRSCFKHSSLMRESLSWETCCTYTLNNTSSMIGKSITSKKFWCRLPLLPSTFLCSERFQGFVNGNW